MALWLHFALVSIFGFFSHTIHASDAEKVATQEFGLSNMQVAISNSEVESQLELYGASRPIVDATRAALGSFLNNPLDGESPLGLVIDELLAEFGQGIGGHTRQTLIAEAKDRLRNLLNRPTTLFALVPVQCSDTSRISPPERGESLEKNWVFYLHIGDYSDHLFWAIVSRDRLGGVYNYGFN